VTPSKTFGLIGKTLKHSFSKKYFEEKFEKEDLPHQYLNFECSNLHNIKQLAIDYPNLSGLNVTIPYKEAIIPYLDKLSDKAQSIGAVNCIKITKKGLWKGYNTDAYGFKKSIEPHLKLHHQKALILGTGGASKAVAYVLDELKIAYVFVSRKKAPNQLTYDLINSTVLDNFQIIINTTPLGTFPKVDDCPQLPYHLLTKNHLAFDLVYNPCETLFLKQAKAQGAKTANGENMLHFQAEKGWEIWGE